jgi:hypothetical protein
MAMSEFIYPGKVVIGSCSICGGPVLVTEMWGSVIPDIPTCANCGAQKADNHGPVIPMRPTSFPSTTIDSKPTFP